MKLPELAIRRPVATAMIFIAMVILGIVALSLLGIDYMPNIEIPSISVITTYRGAGPAEVESTITEPIEDNVATVKNVDEIRSISMEGISAVILRFAWGTNLDEATNEIRDKLDLAKRSLPDEADDPILFKFDLAMYPVVIIRVTADESWEKLERIVKNDITNVLERIPGVATATYRGGEERQIKVELDHSKLVAVGISPDKIIQTLNLENLSNPGGHIRMGYKDYLVRTPEEFSSAEEIGKVIIGQNNGTIVRLSDVAHVYDGFREKENEVRVEGRKGMIVMVQKQSGANTVAVAKKVRKELEEIQRNLPPDVKTKIFIDSSDFIKNSISNLRETLIWGGIFVFLVILVFLRNLRASFIIISSIPTSLVITFVLMYFFGYTINLITLSSLVIAIGMVVDDSIVILDNILRHRDRGQKPDEGAMFGANEMVNAVVSSTLTTVAVFAPILFVGGLTAILFGSMAAIISLAMLASLFTALLLVPMLSSKFLGVEKKHTSRFFRVSEQLFTRLENNYANLLGWALNHKKIVIIGAVLLLLITVGLVRFVGMEFMPEEDQNQFSINVDLPIGTRFERTGEVCNKITEIMREKVPELVAYSERWGAGGTGGISSILGREEASYRGSISARLISKTQRNVSPRGIINRIRPLIEKIPGAEVRFGVQDPLAGIMFGGGAPLQIDLYGYDLDTAMQYAQTVSRILASIKGVTDVDISRQMEKPEIQVKVDRDKASLIGLNVTNIGKTVETYFSGDTSVKYREGGDEYDIEVRLRKEDRKQIEDIRDSTVVTPSGDKIKLSNVADIKVGLGPTKIERKDKQRIITVNADIQGRDLASVVKEAEKRLEMTTRPAGFSYKFTGAEEERRKAFGLLVMAAALGMILVYMVMAAQFESLRDPFIIFLSIPFGFIGVVWFLALTHQTLSIVSFIGVIMLIGIVTKNGIVLISYINILRHRGLSVREAVMSGGSNRLRPVLSTTITTILGMIPMALSRGEGSEVWVPMAVAVIGGLSVSTLVTMILMPTLYSIFEGLKHSKEL